MTHVELVIQDFKEQICRLSEERALYFALFTQKGNENATLIQENQQLITEIKQLKSVNMEVDE